MRWLAAAGLAAAAPGCAWTIESLDDGVPLSRASYDAVRVGEDGLGEVLARLGPPREIRVTEHDEVLVWRQDHYAGTHLAFSLLLPGVGAGTPVNPLARMFQAMTARLSAHSAAEERLEEKDPVSHAVPLVLQFLAGSASGNVSAEDVMNLHNRRVRTSRILVVIDRAAARVREKGFLDDTGRGDAWIRSSFLLE